MRVVSTHRRPWHQIRAVLHHFAWKKRLCRYYHGEVVIRMHLVRAKTSQVHVVSFLEGTNRQGMISMWLYMHVKATDQEKVYVSTYKFDRFASECVRVIGTFENCRLSQKVISGILGRADP